MATTPRATVADLLRMPRDGRKYELVGGEIVVSPAGGRHGEIAARLLIRLGAFVLEKGLGRLFDSSTGFTMKSGNTRSPDMSYVTKERLTGPAPDGFIPFAPTLAVEILSPDDSLPQVMSKVGEYFESDVRLVWIIDPRKNRAAVFRSPTEVREIGPGGDLDGEDLLPGFRCGLGGLLD